MFIISIPKTLFNTFLWLLNLVITYFKILSKVISTYIWGIKSLIDLAGNTWRCWGYARKVFDPLVRIYDKVITFVTNKIKKLIPPERFTKRIPNRLKNGYYTVKRSKKQLFECVQKLPGWKFFVNVLNALMACGVFFSTQMVYIIEKYVFIWIILIILQMFIGTPLLYLEALPRTVGDNFNVAVEGSKAMWNIFVTLFNIFATFTNVLNNFVSIFEAFIYKILKPFLYIGSSGRFLLTTNIDPDKITDAVSSSLKQNNFFGSTKQIEEATGALLIAEVPIIIIVKSGLDAFLIFYEILSTIATVFAGLDMGGLAKSGACCSSTPSTALACAQDVFVSILFSIVKIISFDLIPADTIRQIKKDFSAPAALLSQANCKCSVAEGGLFQNIPGCRPVSYTCVKSFNGKEEIWTETATNTLNAANEQISSISSTGTTEESGCPRFIRASRGEERRLEGGGECNNYCYKIDHHEWLFDVCGSEKYYIGHCSKNLTSSQSVIHFNRFVKLKGISSTERRRMLKPKISILEEEEESAEPIDFETVSAILDRLEARQSPALLKCDLSSYGNWNNDFHLLFFRLLCIAVKVGVYDKEYQISDSPFRRHMDVIINHSNSDFKYKDFHEAMVDAHILFYKEVAKEDSLLVSSRQYFNATLNSTSAYIQDLMDKTVADNKEKIANRRNLKQDSGFVTNDCEYLCPDGTCQKKTKRGQCKTPEVWSPAVAVRYSFHIFIVGFEAWDLSQLFGSILKCWQKYADNPAVDPTSLTNIILKTVGNAPDDLIYCFPLFESIPYLPYITFDFRKYLQDSCKGKDVFGSVAPIQKCRCPQYDQDGVFKYFTYWLPAVPTFIQSRLHNAVRVFLFLVTRYSGTVYLDNLWYSLFYLFTTYDEVLLAFNKEFQEFGLSYDDNMACVVLNFGSVTWALTFVLFPMYIVITGIFFPLLFFIYRGCKLKSRTTRINSVQ